MPPVATHRDALFQPARDLVRKVHCPCCWQGFAPQESLFIAEDPRLLGDPVAGPTEPIRFLPSRFDLTGAAIDPDGARCTRLACPRCRQEFPRAMIEVPATIASVVGSPGAGKSHLLATCDDRPLIISVEPQGVDTLAAANPRALIVDCVRLAKEDGAMQAKIKAKGQAVTPLAILRHMLAELVNNASAWHKRGVTRIGFDSLHIIQQMFAAEIVAETNKSRKADNKEALDQLAKDGWGVLGTKMQNFCDTLRAIDFDVLVVAISKQKETGPKYAGLQGAFSDQVNGYFNAVGYIYKQQVPGKGLEDVERLVCWDADSEKLVVKSHGGLKGITAPDAAEWFAAMSSDAELVLKNARLPNELKRKVAGR